MKFPGVNLGSLLFLIFINDLPPTLHTSSVPIIFASDTSVIISSKNLDDLCMLSNKVISQMIKMVFCKQAVPESR
jgi:hypothetical protein